MRLFCDKVTVRIMFISWIVDLKNDRLVLISDTMIVYRLLKPQTEVSVGRI